MITLTWLAQETTTTTTGGDVVEAEYQSLVLDGTEREGYDTAASATEHPVEDGADISDHHRRELRTVMLDVVVSAHPSARSPAWGNLVEGDDPSTRPAVVRQTLDRLCEFGVEVDIDTPSRSYESMLLLSVSEARDADVGDSLKASLSFREVRKVSLQEVEAPAPRVERGRRTADRGRQTGPATEPTAPMPSDPAQRASVLATAVDALARLSGGGAGGAGQ